MSTTSVILAAARASGPSEDVADTELLRRFADDRDEAAFETLVHRHTRLVWNVCRRILGHAQDAEDAFQATFLVLARNPNKPRRWGTTTGFLFGVARRIALKARASAAARSDSINRLTSVPPPDPSTNAAVHELQAILDEEIGRLPEKYRSAFLLCVVGGQSRTQAAAELRVGEGTLSARLARARLRLRNRLAKRGVSLAAAMAVADLTAIWGATPTGLERATVAAGLSGCGSPMATALVGGMRTWRALGGAAALIVCAAVAVGLSVGLAAPPIEPPPGLVEKPVIDTSVVADGRGDPLPLGAVARLSSTRWRHEGEARSMSFSRDGKSLAVISDEDKAITIFETTTGRVTHRQTIRQGEPAPRAVAYSPDGTVLATRMEGGTVQLWDPKTLRRLLALTPVEGEPTSGSRDHLCFSKDGKRLAVWTGPRDVITIWEMATGKPVAGLTGHDHGNPAMVFSPDGKILFLGVSDPDIQLWDVGTEKFVRGFDTGEHAFSLAVSADGSIIASGGKNRIVITDIKSGKERSLLDAEKMGAVLGVEFTPDGKTLVSWSEDAKARVWDLSANKERFVLDSQGWIGRSMALSADGKTLAAGTVYNTIRLWDVATGKELSAESDSHDAPVRAVAFSPDGKLLVTGGANHQTRMWDAVTGRHIGVFRGSAAQVSFSPDGSRLTTAWEWGDRVRVWDVARREELMKLAVDGDDRVPGSVFTPDGKSIVTVSGLKSEDNFGKTVVRTWNVASGKLQREIAFADIRPSALAVSRDGRHVAIGGAAGNGSDPGPSLRLCDLAHNSERTVHHGEMSYVVSVAFSPDNRVLAAGNIDRKVRLVEVATGREIIELTGHKRSVSAVAFAPGGRILATADGGPISRYWDGTRPQQTILFWDVVSGKELARLTGHGSDATSLAFSPDGKRVIVGMSNGTALVWETPAAAKPSSIQAEAGRKLGPKELTALWTDLAREDAHIAHEAMGILLASPEQSLPFLKKALRPASKIDAEKVRQRITELGSEDFKTREAASRDLSTWGEDIEPELRKELAVQPSPEVFRRIDTLLKASLASPPPDRRRESRTVWLLENIGSPASAEILADLAKGDPGALLTREARAAISRR